ELGAFALEQRFEAGLVLHALVHFHVSRRVVAPAHPAAAHAEAFLDQLEQRSDLRSQIGQPVRRNFVIDVVIQTGITASASPPALPPTTPPLNSSPGLTFVPFGSCKRVMRRFTPWPRYWARATISCPG